MCGEEGGSGQYDYISQLDSSEEGGRKAEEKEGKGWRDHCDDGEEPSAYIFTECFAP